MSRLAKRPYIQGDPLPPVGSKCVVAGANTDIESDQDRTYSERIVIGYTPCGNFVCFQTEGCWPTVERLTNCWFAPALQPQPSEANAELAGQDEIGWLIEVPFGHDIIHYISIRDPHEQWRENREYDPDWFPHGRHALVGMLRFSQDANDGLRFARKEDAETFIHAFGKLLIDPRANEHMWPAAALRTGQQGVE